MKRFMIVMMVAVSVSLFMASGVAFAGERVKSKHGYWDFDGIAEVSGPTVQVVVRNRSTDNSYASGRCRAGMASAAVDVELWHSDAGRLGTARVRFQDVCNGGAERKVAISNVPSKYNRLEVRFNITTPNGRHSFKRGRTNWRR